MKRILLILPLLLIGIMAFAQTDINRTTPIGNVPSNTATYNKRTVNDANLRASLTLYVPKGVTPTLNNAKDSVGAVFFKINPAADSSFYVYHGNNNWVRYAKYADIFKVVKDSLANYQKLTDGIVTGLVPTASGNNLSITAGTYRLNNIVRSASARTFSAIPLSASGLQRILVIFGNTSGGLDTLSGAQSTNPVTPILPANTIRLAFTTVTSSSVSPPAPDLSSYAKLTGGNSFSGNQSISGGNLSVNNRYFGITSGGSQYIGSTYPLPNSTSYQNLFIGQTGGNSITSGFANLVAGVSNTGSSLTTGQANTFIAGYGSGLSNTSGGNNVAVGNLSLSNNISGSWNVAIGSYTGQNLLGDNSVILGGYAGVNVTGANNIMIGGWYPYLSGITSGAGNTIIGPVQSLSPTISNNIILADGVGTIRYRWDGTSNNFTGKVSLLTAPTTVTGTQYVAVRDSTSGIIKQIKTSSISAGGVSSITGTTNQVIASSSTGAVTLSLPQSISTSSSPNFGGLNLTGSLVGTSANFSSDIQFTSNAGYGLISQNGGRAIGITNSTVQLNYPLTGTSATFSGKLNLSIPTSTNVPLNMPYGVAPTTPITGDDWKVTTGVRTQTYDGTNTKDYLFDKTNSVLSGLGNVSLLANNAGTIGTAPTLSYLASGTLIKSSAYTITSTDFGSNGFVNVFVSGNTTITLPTASVMSGVQIRVIKTDGAGTTITLSTGGTVTIQNHSIVVVSDGTNRIELL
jgi:hypothetical protein